MMARQTSPRGRSRLRLAALAAATCLTAASAGAQTLRIGLQEDPDMLDPTLARTFVGRIVFAALCDKLIDITPELAFKPMLATSWEWSDDGMALSMSLRDDVVFHDGTKLDGAAVKASLERHLTLKGSNRASEIRPIETVEVVTPTEITLHLKAPFSPLLAALSDRAGMIMSPKAIQAADGTDSFAANPVCAGPFRLVERVAQDRIVVERFDRYYDPGSIGLDRIVYRPIPDTTVRLANLQSGDLDIIERMSTNDLATVRGTPGLRVVEVPSLHYHGIRINFANGPRAQNPLGQSAAVREAFDLAIDRNVINQVAFNGEYIPGNQPVAPTNPFYATDLPIPERDVAKAKELLKQAGQERVSFEMLVGNNPEQMRVAEIIQAMAAEAGIDVRVQAMEFAAALDAMDKGDFDSMLVGWSGRVDPDGNIHTFIESNGGLNDGKYSNPKVDELLNRARTTGDVEERKRLYADAAKIYVNERAQIFLYHQKYHYGVSDKVEGFTPYPDGLIRPFGITKKEG